MKCAYCGRKPKQRMSSAIVGPDGRVIYPPLQSHGVCRERAERSIGALDRLAATLAALTGTLRKTSDPYQEQELAWSHRAGLAAAAEEAARAGREPVEYARSKGFRAIDGTELTTETMAYTLACTLELVEDLCESACTAADR